MRLNGRAGLLPAALTLVLSACASVHPTPSRPVTPSSLPATPSPGQSAMPSPHDSPTSSLPATTAEIELTVSGGPADGSYRAVAHGSACSQDGPGDPLSVHYADPAAADGFTALDLSIRDIAAATDDETDDFGLSLTVSGSSYQVDARAGRGSGAALLELDPLGGATIVVTAEADPGAAIDLSILCDLESGLGS